jgi:hypothetical protein
MSNHSRLIAVSPFSRGVMGRVPEIRLTTSMKGPEHERLRLNKVVPLVNHARWPIAARDLSRQGTSTCTQAGKPDCPNPTVVALRGARRRDVGPSSSMKIYRPRDLP